MFSSETNLFWFRFNLGIFLVKFLHSCNAAEAAAAALMHTTYTNRNTSKASKLSKAKLIFRATFENVNKCALSDFRKTFLQVCQTEQQEQPHKQHTNQWRLQSRNLCIKYQCIEGKGRRIQQYTQSQPHQCWWNQIFHIPMQSTSKSLSPALIANAVHANKNKTKQ